MTVAEPVVVVGSACRFPGSIDTPSKLWELLKEPEDLQTEVPKERFNIDSFYHSDGSHHGRTNARHGYFLKDDIRAFDAPFFNIQAGEAESIDPQQRLLLETTYDAVASAGLGLQDLRGSDTAVYVGIMTHDFELTKVKDANHSPTYFATGAATSIASNRLSYFFDWHGPSMTVDTACSSSLVAVHLAVQQLRSGVSKVAVAAGANLILSPMNYITESKLSMLSPTGRSRMWDANADGYARGEGVCSVVLKTLSQALLDGDNIECVIRETGVNQDGKTTGITMPSHIAQEALIRDTYSRAGLDAKKPGERCQFFEAHGTGTPAGDPQEAEAIAKAFFGDGHDLRSDNLYVGSVKTVIGHTEGTAGIAGLLKASLAVKHGVIPPNMLFENLSPKVAPFYQHLRITKEAQPWPEIPHGAPRRASVNSFGFGGTNAHAIIEEYRQQDIQCKQLTPTLETSTAAHSLPLVLSAKSERSLRRTMENTLQFIKQHPDVSILDLAWTLLSKRSVLPFRHATVGHTRELVSQALENAIRDSKDLTVDFSSAKFSKEDPILLGIFTGQGAQWPGMLKSLMTAIPHVQDIIAELDHSLQTLPTEYRPSWKLEEQLQLEGDASNVKDASFSQPLCAAVQIVLIQLLSNAGVRFTTIVGHSSGEIACAFAAGYISASQAIRIAYLRGFVSHHAASPSGEAGAMLAAGISPEDARELVELETFEGRVCIAASNSPDSTTLSGDADAIAEVQGILEDESKFARLLKVDKAYHSHHMVPCSSPYIKALVDCGCGVADGPSSEASSVAWYSSVHDNKRMSPRDVTAEYWRDNLVSPVLFMQAVENAAIENGPLDAAVEVGCHPALKAPSLTTLKTIVSEELPYTGCMQRGGNDVESFASALGYLWQRFGLATLDPDRFVSKVLSPHKPPQSLSKVLPNYPWDHSRTYWTESRVIKEHLHGSIPHLLLGSLSFSSTTSTLQWQNTVRPRNHEWLQGHALQGQGVFPAAGYVVMAMEAGLHVAGQRPVELLEVLDMSIEKAITFDDENSPAELVLTAKTLSEDNNQAVLSFNIDSCLAKESKLSTSAQGKVVITFGDASSTQHVLPPAQEEHPHMNNVDMKIFYRELDELGYDYSKDFRCIYSMGRADAKATGSMAHPELKDGQHRLVLHPASLDLAFQTIMGAYSAPGDKRLRSIYVPVHVDRIALAPALCAAALNSSERIVQYNTANTYDRGDYLAGNAEVFDPNNGRAVLYQVENLHLKPLSPPSSSEDHRAFTKTVWGPLAPEKLLDDPKLWATEQDKEVIPVIERVCYFYMKDFISQLTDEDRANATKPHQRYIYWNEHVSARVKEGTWHEWYQPSWENDTREQIEQLCADHWYHPHVKMATRVSEYSLSTIRENSNPFLWMDGDGLLTEFYTSYLTSGPGWLYGQDLMNQICHRYQTMDILEIGGGTGSATKYILNIPQLGFNSYTFTDISPAFFEKAKELFSVHQDRMVFQKLDITRSPEEQGFKPHSYDLVVASSVLHATPKLAETMSNVRSLLKPGGQVVLLEATHKDHTRVGYLFGLFPDWWAGLDEGRDLDPFATIEEWDAIFKKTGFSGVDTRTLDRNGNLFPNTLFSTHAVNTKVSRLYEPLSAPRKEDQSSPLVIVGGDSAKSSRIVDRIRQTLPERQILYVKRLRDMSQTAIEPKSTFVVVSELDEETFSNLDEAKFQAVKSIYVNAGHVLWLTENAWVDHPYQAMSIALLRSIRLEHPAIHVQSLDVDDARQLDITFLVEQIVRLEEAAGATEDILWTLEPEVYVSNNRAYIPRIKHDMDRNNRMNSERREILAEFDATKVPVTLNISETGRYLESTESFSPLGAESLNPAQMTIAVQYTLAKAIRVGDLGYLYLVQGVHEGTGRSVIALSDTTASIVHVPSNRVFQLPTAHAEHNILLPVTASLIALRVLSGVAAGSSILIYEPPAFLIETLKAAAKARNVHVYFATASRQLPSAGQWIRLHPRETDTGIQKLLPANLSVFYDLSEYSKSAASPLGQRVASNLPVSCASFGLGHLAQDVAAPILRQAESEIVRLSQVEDSVAAAVGKSQGANRNHDKAVVIPLNSINELDKPFSISTTIDWRSEKLVSARLRSIDSGNLFSQDKTYLLLGLAGSLGRSLARWMITHGAKYVVLSSRNPETPDPKWLEEIKGFGGNITVLPIDVSKEVSIDAGLAQIRTTLPPIAGIAYGPLVLHDALLRNMDLSMMQVPLNSKVIGAQLLHERFSNQQANPLEFFVMFSSVATVGGNPGQANYTAANAYLQALAQQRRAKGLPASTIHIGAVIGVGYLARTQREEEFKAASDTDTLGEDEFLALFAEAVVSGRRTGDIGAGVTATSDIEIITGIPEFSARHKETVKFYDDPRFGNLKIPEGRATAGDSSGSKASVKDRLLKATSMDEVRDIVIDGLSEKMRGTLHIPADEKVNATAPLIDQGVDSLGAITVGSWFSKTLFVDIPLLRVLGGASIAELAEEAAGRLSPSAIPSVPSAERGTVPSSSEGDSTSESESTRERRDSSVDTPLSTPAVEREYDDKTTGSTMQRRVPLSLTQEYSWKLQQQLSEDPTIFHNTIGVFMGGPVDHERLTKALTSALGRHEIFRTAFVCEDGAGSLPVQVIQPIAATRIRYVSVADRAAAEEAYNQLEKEPYDLASGEILKIIDLYWGRDQHLFVIGYHRLGGDGSTTENFLAEVGQLYNGAQLPPPPQYSSFAIRQRSDIETGKLSADISYWTSLYAKPPAVLPIMKSLPQAQKHRGAAGPVAWEQHTGTHRLSAVLAFRIRERAKKLTGVTPMHFYLAAYHVLLARLTGSHDGGDIAIGIADTNRSSSIQDIDTMGFFANLLPVRMGTGEADPGRTFADELTATRDRVREAMKHARVPYGVTLDRLGLASTHAQELQHAPLFQAVFDYRQGAAETGTIGGASFTEIWASRERTPHDVVLEMSDDPARDPLLTVKLQTSLYGPEDPRAFLDAYVAVLTEFSTNTTLRVDEGRPGN